MSHSTPFFPTAQSTEKRKSDHDFNLGISKRYNSKKENKKTRASGTRLLWLKVARSIFHSLVNQEHVSPIPWLCWSEVVAHLPITVTSWRLEPIERNKLKFKKKKKKVDMFNEALKRFTPCCCCLVYSVGVKDVQVRRHAKLFTVLRPHPHGN